MKIIGRGFLAQNLRAAGLRHPDTVMLATGVATTTVTAPEAYERDAEVLYDTLRRCHRSGDRLIYLSTASVAMYGGLDRPSDEDGPLFPPLPYGRHKLAMEAVVARSGVEYLILRMTNLVGRAQRSHQLLPALITQVRSGRVVVHDRACRDLLDVTHAIEIMDVLLRSGLSGEVVNIGSGWPVPVEQIVTRIERRLGCTAVRELRHHAIDAESRPVSIAKLRRFMPDVDERFGLGSHYFEGVVDRYVDSLQTV